MPDAQTAHSAERVAALETELAAVRAEMQDLTYTVSHDLRASLRHILSYAQLVQEDAAALLPEETLGFVNTIADSARHMGVLMDGLMELSRLGSVPVAIAPVPLQALVQTLVQELAAKQPSRPATDPIAWQVANDLPVVLADAALLRAALGQVLENAVKFSANQALAHIAVYVQSDAPVGQVHLQVQDNGAGFNPALQSKLFKPFSRLHTTKQFPGIGMGLALTRKMLQRMGATVQAQGAVQAGCTVCIALPAALPGAMQVTLQDALPEAPRRA